MTLVTLFFSVALGAGPQESQTAKAADALHKEVPPPADPAKAAEAAALEADMKRASGAQQAAPTPGAQAEPSAAAEGNDAGALQPGEKKETQDWADAERWRRYRKRQAKPEDNRETGDWADESRWGRYREEQGALPPAAWAGPRRPPFLRHRTPGIAAILGGLVGTGSGYFYAGEPKNGLIFAIVDPVLVVAFLACEVALNQLVISHDLRSHKRLAPFLAEPQTGQREWGEREAQLASAAVFLVAAGVTSRVLQVIGGIRAAQRTNRTLDRFSFIPVEGGGAFQYQMRW